MGGSSSRAAPPPLPQQEVVSLHGPTATASNRPSYLAAANAAARLAQKCETGQVKMSLAWLPHSFELQKGPSRHLWVLQGDFQADEPCSLTVHFHCRERSGATLTYEAADSQAPEGWDCHFPAGKHQLRLDGERAIDFQRWPLEVFWKLKQRHMDVIPIVLNLQSAGAQSVVHISLDIPKKPDKETMLNLQCKLLRQKVVIDQKELFDTPSALFCRISARSSVEREIDQTMSKLQELEDALKGENLEDIWLASAAWAAQGESTVGEAVLSESASTRLLQLAVHCCKQKDSKNCYVMSLAMLRMTQLQQVSGCKDSLKACLRELLTHLKVPLPPGDEIQLSISLQNFCQAYQELIDGKNGTIADGVLPTTEGQVFPLLLRAALEATPEVRGASMDDRKLQELCLFCRRRVRLRCAQLLAAAMQGGSATGRLGAAARLARDAGQELVQALLGAERELQQLLLELLWHVVRRTGRSVSRRRDGRGTDGVPRPRAVQELLEAKGELFEKLLEKTTAAEFPKMREKILEELGSPATTYVASCALSWGHLHEKALATFSKHGLGLRMPSDGFELPWACFELPEALLRPCREQTWPLQLRVDLPAAMVLCALSPKLVKNIDQQDVLSLALDAEPDTALPKLRSLLTPVKRAVVSRSLSRPKSQRPASPAVRSRSVDFSKLARSKLVSRSDVKQSLDRPTESSSSPAPSGVNSMPTAPVKRCPSPVRAAPKELRTPSPARSVSTVATRASRVSLKEAAGLAGEAASLGIMHPEKLRKLCVDNGLPSEGLRTELISRLLIHRLTNEAPSPEPLAGKSSDGKPPARSMDSPQEARKRLASKSPARELERSMAPLSVASPARNGGQKRVASHSPAPVERPQTADSPCDMPRKRLRSKSPARELYREPSMAPSEPLKASGLQQPQGLSALCGAAVQSLLTLRPEQLEAECRRRGLSPRRSPHAMACRLATARLQGPGSPGSTELIPSPFRSSAKASPKAPRPGRRPKSTLLSGPPGSPPATPARRRVVEAQRTGDKLRRDRCHGITLAGKGCSNSGSSKPQGALFFYCGHHVHKWERFET